MQTGRMTRKEEFLILARQLHAHAQELEKESHWRYELQHLKECRLLYRHLGEFFDRVETVVRLDYKRQTGERAVADLWQNLPPPKTQDGT